jgi:DNA-binding SARP family transcriptional activator
MANHLHADQVDLHVLGGFRLESRGRTVVVPAGGERLLAFLALRGPATRRSVAFRLWPDHSEARAYGCLRSTLWRLPKPDGSALVSAQPGRLALATHVRVDIARARGWAGGGVDAGAVGDLVEDVLPDWYDDWVAMDRERFRQLRLHALEAVSEQLRLAGRCAEAILVGLCAVEAEPLRESAHRQVVLAHLAEGNVAEAVRQVRGLLRVLADLGLPARLSPMLAELMPAPVRR